MAADAANVVHLSAPIRARPRPSAVWLLLLLVVFVFAASCASSSFDLVRVGVAAPLTAPGVVAGRDVVDGVRLAVEEWNRGGGVGGVHLALVAYDSRAPATVRRLASDPRVALVVGYPDREAAENVWPAYEPRSAPAAVLLSAPGSSSAGLPPGMVALMPAPDDVAAIAAAAIAYSFGPTTVAIVASGNQQDIAAARAFARAAIDQHLQIRADLTLAPIEASYTAAAETIRAAAPSVVYVAGQGPDAGALWAEIRQRDARVQLVLGPDAFDEGFLRTAQGFSDGVLAITLTRRPDEAEAAASFVRAFADRYGRPPTALAARAYDAATLGLRALADAIVDGRPTRAAVRDALAVEPSLDGVLGRYTLENGVPRHWRLALYRLDREGVPRLLGEPELR